jgi:Carboxypeptidase regulatory-like domain
MSRMHKFCLLLWLAVPLAAQTSVIRGQITDESGAAVPKAQVTATGGSKTTTVVADDRGIYVFNAIPTGEYRISATAPQLASAPVTVTLASSPLVLNLIVKVVATTERVTVQDQSGPAVSTDPSNNASGLILRGDDLSALSDDPDDLAADLQALAGPSAGPNGGSFFVDGFSGGELPPKDSIREIRINQNPFAAEYDKLGYGKIEIFTKPGSDHYHATLDYNLGTDWWNSRNPFSAEKAPFLLNEFENSGGGPLGHRASFTLDFQRNMVDNGAITNGVMLNPAFAETPFSSAYVVRQRFTRISPRVDYALNENNTLALRYSLTHVDVPGEGIGNLDLASRGYDYRYTNQTVQMTETAVLGAAVNETRFQFFRSAIRRAADNAGPEIQVLGAFNDGGASVGKGFDTQNSYELQNYTTIAHGAHVIKLGARLRGQTDDNFSPLNFNGTFVFGGGLAPALDSNNQPIPTVSENISSLESYRRTRLNLPGGLPSQFTINTGNPALFVGQFDAGIFAADDWRLRPNITISYGFRYEVQTNMHDWREIAPRLALAWAPGAKRSAKTVLRFGAGMFYDRFPIVNTLTADRFNGKVQHSYVLTNPGFYPDLPSISTLASSQSPQAIQEVDAHLRAPYIIQSAVTIERQLPAHTTVALTYSNSHGLHELRSADINAPLPGTYTGVSGSGVFPLGHPGPVFLMESSGLYNQNQLIANINARVTTALSLFGFYVFNRALSNTDGIGTFPSNPYNFSGEYGPAATDIRHRVTMGGSITTRWNIRFSPYLVVQSGVPFDITSGNDAYGTTLFTARPGILPVGTNKPGLIETPYGLLDPNPAPGEPILTRNSGRGPGQISMNLRVGKTIGFGGERASARRASAAAPSAGNPANLASAASGRGLGSLIQAPNTPHRYNLSVSMAIRNLLNHTNPGPINGDVASPLFGRANQAAGTINGEGFSENADNRRLELQIRFTF